MNLVTAYIDNSFSSSGTSRSTIGGYFRALTHILPTYTRSLPLMHSPASVEGFAAFRWTLSPYGGTVP